ncbi:Orf [Escherichia coli]|uniref:Orf n=1 Tax=Escherichia coli O157:H7 TaxID=83334 RepID=Q93UU4_ECO57|nr:orf [Escherichia coli O157:H7]
MSIVIFYFSGEE